MGPQERRTSAARLWVDQEGILHVVSLGVVSTEETFWEFQDAKRELIGKQRVAMLMHAEEWPKGTPGSWSLFVSALEGMCFAAAVIASPASLQAMGAFPKVFDDMLIPFRVFDSEEPALAFLRDHIKN